MMRVLGAGSGARRNVTTGGAFGHFESFRVISKFSPLRSLAASC